MKNKLYLLLITVMACFALSACGDSDEGTKEMKTYEYDNSGDVVIENDSLKLLQTRQQERYIAPIRLLRM